MGRHIESQVGDPEPGEVQSNLAKLRNMDKFSITVLDGKQIDLNSRFRSAESAPKVGCDSGAAFSASAPPAGSAD